MEFSLSLWLSMNQATNEAHLCFPFLCWGQSWCGFLISQFSLSLVTEVQDGFSYL